MKLLFINQTFYPDVTATGQYLTDLAIDLARKGHEITVLTSRRGYTEPHPLFAPYERFQNVEIFRAGSFYFGRKNRWARVLDAVCLNLAFAFKLIFLPKFDRVVSLTSPPLVAWISCLFARFRQKRSFFYWVMDINPDEAIQAGWVREESLKARILEKALQWVLKKSEGIVVLDRFMKDRIVSKGASEEKVHVISLWAQDEDWAAISCAPNSFRSRYDLENKFLVMYSGNHSICHPLDTLLEAALLLKDNSSIQFVFIGSGYRVKDVLDAKRKHGLANIVHLPYQQRSELKYSLSSADVHVVVMGTPYVGIVHPSKIYGILQTGRPFIYVGPVKSPIGDLMSAYQVGHQVPHGAAHQLAEIIQSLRHLDEKEKEIIGRKEQAAARDYSRKKIGAELGNVLTGEISRDSKILVSAQNI